MTDSYDLSTDGLANEYGNWLSSESLPKMSADELIFEELTTYQRKWLTEFIQRWEAVEGFDGDCILVAGKLFELLGVHLSASELHLIKCGHNLDMFIDVGSVMSDAFHAVLNREPCNGEPDSWWNRLDAMLMEKARPLTLAMIAGKLDARGRPAAESVCFKVTARIKGPMLEADVRKMIAAALSSRVNAGREDPGFLSVKVEPVTAE